MTTTKLNKPVYFIAKDGIEKITYKEYLDRWGSDKTTSPRGVQSRIHIRENEENGIVTYQLWDWRTNGLSAKFIKEYEKLEDATLAKYDLFANQIEDNAPQYFDTYIEAIEYIKDDQNLVESKPEMMAQLYIYNGVEYVVLCDNTIITREEDNQFGTDQAIFPYNF